MKWIILTVNIKFQCLGRECLMCEFAAVAQMILRLQHSQSSICALPQDRSLEHDRDFQNCFFQILAYQKAIKRDFQHLNFFFLTAKDKYQITCLFFFKCPTGKIAMQINQNKISQTPSLYKRNFKLLWELPNAPICSPIMLF